jgi:hypothetical protein
MASLKSELIVTYQGISSIQAGLLTEFGAASGAPPAGQFYQPVQRLEVLLALSVFEC